MRWFRQSHFQYCTSSPRYAMPCPAMRTKTHHNVQSQQATTFETCHTGAEGFVFAAVRSGPRNPIMRIDGRRLGELESQAERDQAWPANKISRQNVWVLSRRGIQWGLISACWSPRRSGSKRPRCKALDAGSGQEGVGRHLDANRFFYTCILWIIVRDEDLVTATPGVTLLAFDAVSLVNRSILVLNCSTRSWIRSQQSMPSRHGRSGLARSILKYPDELVSKVAG